MVYKKKGLNEGLKNSQEEKRKNTILKIEEAIKSFQDEKYQDITIQMLIDSTGFTRPTFSKPHVRKILEQYKIGKYKTTIELPKSDEDKLKFLERTIQKYMATNEKLSNDIVEKDLKINKLNEELRKAKLEIEYLNQEIYQLSKEKY